jgi:hypothetical protein
MSDLEGGSDYMYCETNEEENLELQLDMPKRKNENRLGIKLC